jgi:ATP-dependent RNA helicase DHX29
MGGRSRKADIDDSPPDEDDEPDVLSGAKLQTTYSKQTRTTIDCLDHHAINYDLIVILLENLCFYQPDLVGLSSAILIFLPSLESIRRLSDVLEGHQAFGSNQFLILPLHSTISNENQSLVFNVPRAGVRKIVISTYVPFRYSVYPKLTMGLLQQLG